MSALTRSAAKASEIVMLAFSGLKLPRLAIARPLTPRGLQLFILPLVGAANMAPSEHRGHNMAARVQYAIEWHWSAHLHRDRLQLSHRPFLGRRLSVL